MSSEEFCLLLGLGLLVLLATSGSYFFARSGREANYIAPTSAAWDVGTSVAGLVLGLALSVAALTGLAIIGSNASPALATAGAVAVSIALLAALARPASRRWHSDTDLAEDRRRQRQQVRQARQARHRRRRTYWD